jgi:hypothetical protein
VQLKLAMDISRTLVSDVSTTVTSWWPGDGDDDIDRDEQIRRPACDIFLYCDDPRHSFLHIPVASAERGVASTVDRGTRVPQNRE